MSGQALVDELREIHQRSRENAAANGWGVPPADEDHSPWSRAADAIEALEAELAATRQDAANQAAWNENLLTQAKANRVKERGVLVEAIKRETARAELAEQERDKLRDEERYQRRTKEAALGLGRYEKRLQKAEQKSAELAAVIAEIQRRLRLHFFQTEEFDSDDLGEIVFAVPADVLSAYTTRIREEALACEEVEYTFSEVLDDGTVAYSSPFATLEEAAEAQAKARMNYPWPEEIGLARRRAPGPWAVIPEGEDR